MSQLRKLGAWGQGSGGAGPGSLHLSVLPSGGKRVFAAPPPPCSQTQEGDFPEGGVRA